MTDKNRSFHSDATVSGGGVITLPCFRCGHDNLPSLLYCTKCGVEFGTIARARSSSQEAESKTQSCACFTSASESNDVWWRRFLEAEGAVLIGRSKDVTAAVAWNISGGKTISRRHAELWATHGYWVLRDLGSANGTYVNEQQVQPKRPVFLVSGDRVSLGDEQFVFTQWNL